MTRELTPDERAHVAAFFGPLPFDQNRHWLLEEKDLIAARERNNIDRPSYVGAVIHDLLTTIAVIAGQRNERGVTIAAVERALGPHNTGDIAGDVTALRDAYDLLRQEIRAAARVEQPHAVGDRWLDDSGNELAVTAFVAAIPGRDALLCFGERGTGGAAWLRQIGWRRLPPDETSPPSELERSPLRLRCDACGREARAAGACAECGAPVRVVAIKETAPAYEREPEDDDVG